MIKVNNIYKSFKNDEVLKNITFNFEKGSIVGFLGPNGAGKSTLIKILTGVISPDKGTIYINNENIAENRKITKSNIGYIPEVPAGFNNLTVKEFLFFCGELRDLKKDIIKSKLALINQQFQIKDIFQKRMESLSKGLRQRIWLIQALLHNPDILLLDEPTDGLDPIQKKSMINFIKNIGFNKTIIITSHTLEDLQILCNHVLIIKDGTLVFNDDLETVLKNYNDLNNAYMQIIN
ncbi:MAG: ABC transporter ATP-binding protein [bacterium]